MTRPMMCFGLQNQEETHRREFESPPSNHWENIRTCRCVTARMPRFAVDMPDDLNREFRIRVAEIYVSEKGAVTHAVQDAIKVWLKETINKRSRK